MLDWQIDDLLERWAVEGKRRFSPTSVCRELGTDDFQAVTAHMLGQTNRKLIVRYEVECPYGHSDFSVTDPTKIPMEPRRCRLCEADYEYTPDPNRIWVVFDFTPEFVEFAKKKSTSHSARRQVGNDQTCGNSSSTITYRSTTRGAKSHFC